MFNISSKKSRTVFFLCNKIALNSGILFTIISHKANYLISNGIISMKNITFKQYRTIDLSILCVLTAVFEAIATMASNQWFNLQAMSISISFTIACITLIRWNQFATLPAFIGSFIYCYISGGSLNQYIAYCGGSLFILLALPLMRKLTKEKIKQSFLTRALFVITAYLLIIVGRWCFSLPFAFTFNTLLAFLGTDILSLLFAVVVLSLITTADGFLEDQKAYLFRLERERQEEERANLNDPF